MLTVDPRGVVSAIAQPGSWHFDIPIHGEAHGQQGVPMPFGTTPPLRAAIGLPGAPSTWRGEGAPGRKRPYPSAL